ncbi:MAG: polysaccharide deacetylase family protein [Kiritimatiellia bacterium]
MTAFLAAGSIFCVILVLGGVAGVWRETRRPRVLCLMYHRLASAEDYGCLQGTERIFTLPADVFEAQLAFLKRAGFSFVGPDMICQFALGETQLPDQSVLLTFDDGCVSVDRIARPILERYGACATTFVTTDPNSYVFSIAGGAQRRMTEDELRQADGKTMRFESHAVSHKPLSGMSDDEIWRELADSKKELERVLGREVRYLAIPGNWFDRRVMRIAKQVGYRAVWCSNPATIRKDGNPYRLPRINVEGHLSVEQFARAISPSGIAIRRLVSVIKRTPGRILGPACWERARKLLFRCVPGGYLTTRRVLVAVLFALVAVAGLLSLVVAYFIG